MGDLVVKRVNAAWQDRRRDYTIFVDGVKVASVANDSQTRIRIADGQHVIRLGIDWVPVQ